MLSAPSLSLVDGALDPARDVSGTAGHLTLTLPAALTAAVADAGAGGVPWRHQRCAADRPGGGGCGLVPAARPGLRGHAVLLDLEGHGREEMFADVDLSRTVGWFTSLFPVRLDPGALDLEEAHGGRAALGRALKIIKEQLRALPDNGLGYGVLRYLNPRDRRRSLPALRRRRSASTISGVLRPRRRRTGARRPRRWGSAAAIRDAARARARGQCAHAR